MIDLSKLLLIPILLLPPFTVRASGLTPPSQKEAGVIKTRKESSDKCHPSRRREHHTKLRRKIRISLQLATSAGGTLVYTKQCE